MLDEKEIDIYAYTLETILAEKYETIIRRGIGNTRARDFYDLYVLFHLYKDEINPEHFKMAVEHTAEKRGSIEILTDYESICEDVKTQDVLISDWKNYVTAERYAARLTFNEVVQNSIEVGNFIKSIK